MHEKLTKCPNFTRFLPEKIVFARIWEGATAPCPPVSYAYVNKDFVMCMKYQSGSVRRHVCYGQTDSCLLATRLQLQE